MLSMVLWTDKGLQFVARMNSEGVLGINMIEEWKTIEENSNYEISNLGRIETLETNIFLHKINKIISILFNWF